MANLPDPLHALNTLTPWEELEAEPHVGRKPILVSFLETAEGQERFEKILTYIKAGAFEHVAAQAMGIDRSVWMRWKKEGRAYLLSGKSDSPWAVWYKEFYTRVNQAINECRMLAEVDVRNDDPKFWLTRGPGRGDRIDDPGWVESTAIEIHQEAEPNRTENHLHIHTNNSDAAEEMEAIESEEREINNLASVLQQLETLGIMEMTDTGRGMTPSLASPDTLDSTASPTHPNGKQVSPQEIETPSTSFRRDEDEVGPTPPASSEGVSSSKPAPIKPKRKGDKPKTGKTKSRPPSPPSSPSEAPSIDDPDLL
jgi:hypothetical protein